MKTNNTPLLTEEQHKKIVKILDRISKQKYPQFHQLIHINCGNCLELQQRILHTYLDCFTNRKGDTSMQSLVGVLGTVCLDEHLENTYGILLYAAFTRDNENIVTRPQIKAQKLLEPLVPISGILNVQISTYKDIDDFLYEVEDYSPEILDWSNWYTKFSPAVWHNRNGGYVTVGIDESEEIQASEQTQAPEENIFEFSEDTATMLNEVSSMMEKELIENLFKLPKNELDKAKFITIKVNLIPSILATVYPAKD